MLTTLVSLLLFIVGIFVGRVVAQRKARNAAPAPLDALAKAWQQGFDAAAQSIAAGAQKTGGSDAVLGSLAREHTEQASEQVPVPPTPAHAQSHGFPEQSVRPDMPSARPGQGRIQQPHNMPPNGMATHLPPVPRVPVAAPVDPRQRALRNINITLYVAALLVVAAASLFISFALAPVAKVIGLGLVTAGFYAVGLVMHARSERLRPAASAFTATGLALLPMTGLAYLVLLGSNPASVWLGTSLVGTAAFMYAAGKLRSRVIAALSTTFMVSVAYSGGAVLNRGLIYYFLFSMVLAALITLARIYKPRWLNNIYLQSFTAAHTYLVPATLLAAFLSMPWLHARDYGWLFAAATAYYVVAAVGAQKPERYGDLLAARSVAMLSLLAFMLHFGVVYTDIVRVLSVVFLLQAVLLSSMVQWYVRKLAPKPRYLRVEIWMLLALAACTMVAGFATFSGSFWFSSATAYFTNFNWALPVVLLGSLMIAFRLRGAFLLGPLGVALLGLLDVGVLAPGRQAIIVSIALGATWWMARQRGSRWARRARIAVRLVVPLAVALIFVFAATGWMLTERAVLKSLAETPGLESSWFAGLSVISDYAGATGFVVGVLGLIGNAAWNLRGLNPANTVRDDAQQKAAGTTSLSERAEALFFVGGLGIAVVGIGWMQLKRSMKQAPAFLEVGWGNRFWGTQDLTQPLMWVMLALGLLGAMGILGTSVAQNRQSSGAAHLDQVRVLVHAGGGVALLGALWISAFLEPRWLIELVALIGLSYVVRRLLAGDRTVPGAVYAVAAQLLFSGTAWHMAGRFQMDAHGQFALFAVTTTVAQSVRVLVGQRISSIRSNRIQVFFSGATLGLLLLVLLSYLGWASGYDQAALLIQLLCLLLFITAVLKVPGQIPAQLHNLAKYGLWSVGSLALIGLILTPTLGNELRAGGWLPVGLWNHNVAALMLMVLLITLILSERLSLGAARQRHLRGLLTVIFLGAFLLVTLGLGDGWQLVAGILGSVTLVVFAASWGIPLLLGGTVMFLLYAVSNVFELFREAAIVAPQQPRDLMLVLGSSALVLLMGSIFAGRFEGEIAEFSSMITRSQGFGPGHGRVLFTSTLFLAALAGLAGLESSRSAYVYVGAGIFVLALVAAAAVDVPRAWRESAFEIVYLVGAATLQRCLIVGGVDFGFFGGSYYWVLLIAALAAFEFYRKREIRAVVTLSIAAGLLSLTGLSSIVLSTLSEQMIVLLSFAALLVFGLLSNRRMFTLWAAIGIGAAVFWFLRGYTFVLLLMLAVLLIALALWRLGKMNKDSANKSADPMTHQPPDSSLTASANPPHTVGNPSADGAQGAQRGNSEAARADGEPTES